MMGKRIIVLVQMHFIQRKQFSEINVASHAFHQISNLNFFLNASARATENAVAAREPVVGTH